jgi:hypothetical protein
VRAGLAALSAAAVLAGCGEKAEPGPGDIRSFAVTGTVELESAPPGPPDAGTQGGHGAPDGAATTTRPAFSFSGAVTPASARVAADAGEVTRRGSRFTVTLRGLRRGPNRVELTATAPGAREWTYEAVITRR